MNDVIVCVEDDDSIRELMLYTLNMAGFKGEGFADAKSLKEYLKKEKPKLILLDIMLPDEDGISILKRLKEKSETKNIPVIMATARGTEYDKVLGLDLGADDYLSKPFGMMEMIARIKAVLRRTGMDSIKKEVINYKGLVINRVERAVSADDMPIELTLKEYEILSLLMEYPGKVFTREVLLSNIWGMDFVGETRTIDVHIATLRTKLKEYGNLIKTVRGVGYRMGE